DTLMTSGAAGAFTVIRLEESPKIRGLDVVADGAGLGALAQGLRERQEQRQHTDEERYLLVDVVEQVRVPSMVFAMLDLMLDFVLDCVDAMRHRVPHHCSAKAD